MKRKSSEDDDAVFEDTEAIGPYMWRINLLEHWAKNIVEHVKLTWKKRKPGEVSYGENKGMKEIDYGVWLQCCIDIPPNVLEPRFEGERCYVSETRWKQLKNFVDHFEDTLLKKVTQMLKKEIPEIVRFKESKGVWHRQGNLGYTLSIYFNKEEGVL